MKWHIDPTKLCIHNKLVFTRSYFTNGKLWYERHFLNGQLHNLNGPAYRIWYDNGLLRIELYYLNGNLHNPNGPAYRIWYDNGQLWYEEYWLNGERLSQAQFLAKLNK